MLFFSRHKVNTYFHKYGYRLPFCIIMTNLQR